MDSHAFQKPRTIREGSTLAIVAPSSPFDRDEFDAGIARLRARYVVKFDDGIRARAGYLAGDDDRRAAELLRAIEDPDVDAIVCARGGYGATRLLPRVSVGAVRDANRLLVGFSDVTALHAIWAQAGVRSIHGAMVAALGRGSDALAVRWTHALEGTGTESLDGLSSIVPGRGQGPLVGGNLAVLTALVGTPYAPPLDGAVLFLEDIGERPYRVDRMLTHLEHAGWFARASAVLLGGFTDAVTGADGTAVYDVIRERLGRLRVPVLAGVPSGHLDDNLELPFGAITDVDSDAGTLRFAR